MGLLMFILAFSNAGGESFVPHLQPGGATVWLKALPTVVLDVMLVDLLCFLPGIIMMIIVLCGSCADCFSLCAVKSMVLTTAILGLIAVVLVFPIWILVQASGTGTGGQAL